MPRNEAEPQPRPHMTLEVESAFDPESNILCCGKPTVQQQIDYQITLNRQTFTIPGVWASVCSKCGKSYFDCEVGNAIMDRIFEIQHPIEAMLSSLMKG